MKRAWIGALAAGAVVAGCGEVDTSNDMAYEAKDACRHFVESHLKSPSTADFSSENVSGVGENWTCSGNVDSQNSFGATVRNSFTISVEKRPDGRWYEVSVQGITN